MIIRKKILDKIDFSKQKVATIVAPAGYGKTSLIDQIIGRANCKMVRVDIDSFSYGIVDVVISLLDELSVLSSEFIDLRSRITTNDYSKINITAIIRNIVNILNQYDSARLMIVIEDLHELRDCKEANSLIDILIKRTDNNIKFILSSRKKIQISLLKLIGMKLIKEIDEKDLQFSRHEIVELVNENNGDVRDQDLISQLEYVTDGWPVLVALLSGEYGKRIYELKHSEISNIITTGHVFDFLVDEICKDLSKQENFLLMHVWPFATIDFFKLGAVVGLKRKQVVKLLESGLPIRRLADNEYKIHPLFKEMLKRKYFEEYDSIDNSNWEQINDLAITTNSKKSLIEFYMNIDDMKNCEKYFSSYFEILIETGEVNFIVNVIEYLAARGLQDIDVKYYEASVLYSSGKLEEAYNLLRSTLSQLLVAPNIHEKELNFTICRSALKLKEIGLFLYKADPDLDNLLTIVHDAKEVKNNYYLLERSLSIYLRLDCYSGNFTISFTKYDEYSDLLSKVVNFDELVSSKMISNLGMFNYFLGNHVVQLGIIKQYGGDDLTKSRDLVYLNNLGNMLFETGNYSKAIESSRKSLLMQNISSNLFDKHIIYETYCIIYSYISRNLKSESVVYRCIHEAHEIGDYFSEIEISHGLIDLYRRNQRTQDAKNLSRSTLIKAKKLKSSFLLYWSLICFILPYSSSGQLSVGKNFFKRARGRLSSNFAYLHFKIDYLEAIYAYQNNQPNANELFDNVIRKAKAKLYNHFFIEEGVLHLDMYLAAYDRGTEREYIKSSLTALGDGIFPDLVDRFLLLTQRQQELVIDLLLGSESRSSIDALRKVMSMVSGDLKKNIRLHLEKKESASKENKKIKFLTKRETEILSLIASGHKNSELAKDLFISEKTVKTHINRIFFKLGVKDRQDAIRLYKKSYEPRQKGRQQAALH